MKITAFEQSGSTTIDGISDPIEIAAEPNLTTPLGFVFTGGSSPVGSVEGAIVDIVAGEDPTTYAGWEIIDGSDVSDGCRGMFARVTHVRLNLSSGSTTCRMVSQL
jgi:hypothetical protein